MLNWLLSENIIIKGKQMKTMMMFLCIMLVASFLGCGAEDSNTPDCIKACGIEYSRVIEIMGYPDHAECKLQPGVAYDYRMIYGETIIFITYYFDLFHDAPGRETRCDIWQPMG